MTPARAGILGAVAAFVFFAGAMNAMMRGWPAWYRLARDGQVAQAKITRLQPEIHQTCHFEFSIGPKAYEGSDQGCHAQIGDTVRITYAPTDPSFATTASPKEELTEQVVGALGMACLAGVSVWWQVRRKQRASSAAAGCPTRISARPAAAVKTFSAVEGANGSPGLRPSKSQRRGRKTIQ